MLETLQAQAMPLVRSGGLFLAIVGVALVLGGFVFKRRYQVLIAGAVLGAIALAVTAIPLGAPYGRPSTLSLASLAVAIAFEIIAIVTLVPRAARHGERAVTLTLLAVVGAHLLIMTPAFGALVAALGLANLANAGLGAVVTLYPTRALWAVDGALKAAFGVAMLLTR